MTPEVGSVAVACAQEVEMMDGAFPKILLAEETGDPVSDLYEALLARYGPKPRQVASTHAALIERVLIEPAIDKGGDRCEEAGMLGSVDSGSCSNSP